MVIKGKKFTKFSKLYHIYLGSCLWPWKCEPYSGSYDTHRHIGTDSIFTKGYYFEYNCNETEAYEVSEAAVNSLRHGILGSIVIFCLMVPSFWPLFSHLPRDVSNSCLLPPQNVVRNLIFCLVIPEDLWMKRAIKIQNVFLGGGFQNWSLWGSHPLGFWIPSLCNVEKLVGENLLF